MKFRIEPDDEYSFGWFISDSDGNRYGYFLTLWGAKRHCRRIARKLRRIIEYEVEDDSTGWHKRTS